MGVLKELFSIPDAVSSGSRRVDCLLPDQEPTVESQKPRPIATRTVFRLPDGQVVEKLEVKNVELTEAELTAAGTLET